MNNPPTVTATASLLAALSLDGKDSVGERQVNGSALELLISELVNTLTLTTQETKSGSEQAAQVNEPNEEATEAGALLAGAPKRGTGARGPSMVSGWQEVPDDTELMEQVYVKLELIGFRIGRRLAERFAPPNRRLADTLDIVKFVCKDIWMVMFNRQIDNLKTNHRGIY
ncbi:hypothetical protein GGI24_006971, partial [Coemansia furcata]